MDIMGFDIFEKANNSVSIEKNIYPYNSFVFPDFLFCYDQ